MAVDYYVSAGNIAEFLSAWLKDRNLPSEVRRPIDKYYRHFVGHFDDRLQYFYARQIREVEELIAHKPGLSILEVGCGLGSETLWFATHGAEVTALDIKGERLGVARARHQFLERRLGRAIPCRFVQESLFSAPPGPYDVVWLEQAFHHIEPREEACRRLFTLVKPGGHLVVSEANGANPFLQLQLFMQRGWKTIDTWVDEAGKAHPYGVERILTGSQFRRTMERTGFVTQSLQHFRLFPSGAMFGPLFSLEKAWGGRPKWLATHFNYVGRRLPAE